MSLYFDSAYVAKCYVNEADSGDVRRLAQDQELHSSAWCLAELACVLHRHFREGSLSRREASKAQELFRGHVEEGRWTLLPVSISLLRDVESAMERLPPDVFLRAGDAVHLVSAREAGFTEIWSNDRRLLAAARHFGLKGRSV